MGDDRKGVIRSGTMFGWRFGKKWAVTKSSPKLGYRLLYGHISGSFFLPGLKLLADSSNVGQHVLELWSRPSTGRENRVQ
jgi:hypothetical protein